MKVYRLYSIASVLFFCAGAIGMFRDMGPGTMYIALGALFRALAARKKKEIS